MAGVEARERARQQAKDIVVAWLMAKGGQDWNHLSSLMDLEDRIAAALAGGDLERDQAGQCRGCVEREQDLPRLSMHTCLERAPAGREATAGPEGGDGVGGTR